MRGSSGAKTRRLYYVRALRELWRDRQNCRTFLIATAIHGVAQGIMAVCAGLIGQALLGRQVVGAVALQPFIRRAGAIPSLILCLIGLISAIVKATSGAISVYAQKRAAFRVGDGIRLEVTDRMLEGGRSEGQASEAQAALVVRVRDVERGIDDGLLAGARAI